MWLILVRGLYAGNAGLSGLIALARRLRHFVIPCHVGLDCNHGDAVNRTGCHAQIATGAPIGQDGMHFFIRADDGVHRTGLNAERTADAVFFFDDREFQRFVKTTLGV